MRTRLPYRWPLFAVVSCALAAGDLRHAVALPDHTSYDLVLGQVRLGTSRANGTDAHGFYAPVAVAIDRTSTPNHAYVADSLNGRILCWKDIATLRAGATPDLIIGQPDPVASTRLRSDSSAISLSTGVDVDRDGTLWVSDTNNARVLGFRKPFEQGKKDITADVLIGQPDFGLGYFDKACSGGYLFSGPRGDASPSNLCSPGGVAADPDGNLWVSDTGNSRVLLFLAPIPTRNAAASMVLGQDSPVVTADKAPCNKGGTAPDTTTLCRPGNLSIQRDGGGVLHLYVTDVGNHRILQFDDPMHNHGAVRVFGQPDFVTGRFGNGPDHLRNPGSVALDPGGTVWIGDGSNNRTLGFPPPFAGTAGLSATYVIGQADFTSTVPNRGVAGMPLPSPSAVTAAGAAQGAVTAGGTLVLPDPGNHRVLFYDHAAQVSPAADQQAGQVDLAHGGPNRIKANGLIMPGAVAVDRPGSDRPGESIHVYVSDFGNHRVLGYADLSTLQNGQPADLVFGQVNFSDGTCNRDEDHADASTLCWPRGVTVDAGGDLWVADAWNHRVLHYPRPFAVPKGTTQRADLVLGQADFIGRQGNQGAAAPSATSLFTPLAVSVDKNGVLWVADRDNHRVLGFRPPFATGQSASLVLLGPVAGGLTQQGCQPDNGTTKKTDFLCAPMGLALDASGNLWVAERDNNRVALYVTTPKDGNGPDLPGVPLVILGQPSGHDVAVNGGMTMPSSTSLNAPEAVSVEVDASGNATALVVADTGNNRVLIYAPITQGFQPAATQVIGQGGRFDTNMTNLDNVHNDAETGVSQGMVQPNAVLALPEVLVIAEGGTNPGSSARPNLLVPPLLFRVSGNNRVVLIKGPTFPKPPPSPDMAVVSPSDGGTQIPAPDIATPGPPSTGGGCGCAVGGAPAHAPPVRGLALAFLMVGWWVRRRQPKRC